MLKSFAVTFEQVFVLFVFIFLGYCFKKSGKLSADFNKGISTLTVNIFLPFLTFDSMAKNFDLKILAEKSNIIWASATLLCFFLVLAFVFSRLMSKKSDTRDVFMYSFTFPNSGYIGNPLMLAIFGELMLFDFMIFCIPFFILTYTFGIYVLSPNKELNFKNLVNPMMVSLVLGMIVGALGIKMPTVVTSIVEKGADCMAPSAMILTGVVFASGSFKTMVTNVKIYIACMVKMILIPLVFVLVVSKTAMPHDMAIIMVVMLTLPTGLNSIVFPEAHGGDSRTGAQLCFVSTMTCLFVMPLMVALYEHICL